MKTLLACFTGCLLMLLFACGETKRTETTKEPVIAEDALACFEPQDVEVSFEEATNWILWWGEFFASECTNANTTANPAGGYWPVQFATDMSSFQTLIKNHNSFRVYYAMCNDEPNGGRAHLLAAPLDNSTCNAVIDDNIYSFPTSFNPGETPYEDCSPDGATTTTIPKATAISWTTNFRDQFGVSTTNDQSTLTCSGVTLTVPIAFSFDKESFEDNINQEASTLYVKLGIDTIHNGAAVTYEFKLLFDTAGESGVGEGIDYVDFASPCPQACVGVDPLL